MWTLILDVLNENKPFTGGWRCLRSSSLAERSSYNCGIGNLLVGQDVPFVCRISLDALDVYRHRTSPFLFFPGTPGRSLTEFEYVSLNRMQRDTWTLSGWYEEDVAMACAA